MKSTYIMEINIHDDKMPVSKVWVCEKLHKAEIVYVGVFRVMECFYSGPM
jgi:hypothetical protein